MRADSTFRLQDKNIAIIGPFSNLTQNLMASFCEYGSDVALLGPASREATRYAENLTDTREIHQSNGRVFALEADLSTAESAREGLAKAAQSFGGVDVVIDTRPLMNLEAGGAPDSAFTAEAFKFLEGRGKGRMIFLSYDSSLVEGSVESLRQFVVAQSKEVIGKHITVNMVTLGLTEEYLLKKFPKMPSIKLALTEFAKTHPQAKLIDGKEIAYTVAFLASPLCASLTGQNLVLSAAL